MFTYGDKEIIAGGFCGGIKEVGGWDAEGGGYGGREKE